ncbi:MAG: LysR family transcriptional regulator [Ramlibacter sp.]
MSNTTMHQILHGAQLNLARFDLVSIRLVVLCQETGSLSEAARIAHMSKSNASQRLASLESSVRQQLFVRDYRGLRPTPAGRVFATHGRTILEELGALNSQMLNLSMDLPHELSLRKNLFDTR